MASSSMSANVVLRTGIVVLTLGTACIHFSLNFPDPGFILNGLGYVALLAALYLPVPQLARYGNVVRWILIGYAALTILLWILFGDRTLTGYTAKAIEIALIALLLLDARKSLS
jgi:membrane-bound ClpP family serine protease